MILEPSNCSYVGIANAGTHGGDGSIEAARRLVSPAAHLSAGHRPTSHNSTTIVKSIT